MKKTPNRMHLCTALLVLNLVFIWGNSMLPASVSSALSEWVKELIAALFPGDDLPLQGHGLLRKLAHFCEFCTLGMLFLWFHGMRIRKWSRVATYSMICAMAVAGLDEMIQIVSPGRNPSILDVALDSFGAAIGIGILYLGFYINRKTKKQCIISGGKQI